MKDLIYREDALNFDMEIELEEGEDIESICKGAQLVMEHIRSLPTATEVKDLRNELCLKCGEYKRSHLGACYGCRWKE